MRNIANIFTHTSAQVKLSVMARVSFYCKCKHRLTIIVGYECKREVVSLRLPLFLGDTVQADEIMGIRRDDKPFQMDKAFL